MKNIKMLQRQLIFFKLVILLTFLALSSVSAQWNLMLSTTQEFSSNPFRSVDPYSDFISSFDIGIEREFDSFNILYYGSYNSFNKVSDISYYWHQLGFYNETENFMWGAYFEQRINKQANNYFDYMNYAGYVKKSFNLFSINWDANISFSSMNYSVIPDFNNWIGSGRIIARKSFETKTTLIGAFIYNYKGFKNYSANIDSVYGGEYIYYTSEDVNISQIELNGRVAQAIGENTGLALNVHYKNILSGSGFSASLIESTYGDMELYDDPVSQEGYSVGGMLTHIFSDDITLKLSYFYYDKSYPSQGVYLSDTDYNVDIARKDTQSSFAMNLAKTLFVNNKNGNMLDLSLALYIINNTSNSYYFNYDINTFSISLNYSF